MESISIKKLFSDDYISRQAGEKLRLLVLSHSRNNQPVEVDFTGITIASTSFFDEGFAKLLSEDWDLNKLHQLVLLKNIHPLDRKLLERVIRLRQG